MEATGTWVIIDQDLTVAEAVVWHPGLAAAGCESEFYFYLWLGPCPFVYSVSRDDVRACLREGAAEPLQQTFWFPDGA